MDRFDCTGFNNRPQPCSRCNVMANTLASCAVDCGFQPQSGQTNTEIGIYCFSAKQAA